MVVNRLQLLAAVGLLASSLGAQNPKIFPALLWGDNQWISIKLSNQSKDFTTVRVDVFRRSGESIPIEPLYRVPPGSSVEVRVDNQATPGIGMEQWAWARVEQLEPLSEGLTVRTTVEILRGNEILTFPVAAQAQSSFGGTWSQRSQFASHRDFYFLNTSGETVSVKFCATNEIVCGKNDRVLLKRRLAARETIILTFGKLPKRYLAIESDPARSATLGFLRPQKGDKHRFSSESSVQFEGAEK